MSNHDTKQTARSFAVAFGVALEQVLAPLTQTEWTFEPTETVGAAEQKSIASFRLVAEGTLKGEFFVEFSEPQLLAILSAVKRQPVQTVGTEHLDALKTLINSAAEKLGGALAAEWGAMRFRVEEAAAQTFDGMPVVALAATADAGSQVFVYFGAQLLDALAARTSIPSQAKDADWSVDPRNLRLVMDVELNVTLRFGQRKLQLREVLDLTSGSIVELDRMVDEPVELFLGDKLIARGEAVVVDGNYGLRVSEIPHPLASHLLN